jgi:hypothetical protein
MIASLCIELVIRTLVVFIAPLRAAPTARVERRQDLANILRESFLSKSMIYDVEDPQLSEGVEGDGGSKVEDGRCREERRFKDLTVGQSQARQTHPALVYLRTIE